MEKLIKYLNVPIAVHELVRSVAAIPVPVRTQYGGATVGECHSIRAVDGQYYCTVESSVDLKGRYPTLTGEIGDGGVMRPFSLVATYETLNVDENQETFI